MSNSSKTKKTANILVTHKHTNTQHILTHNDTNILDLQNKSGGVAPPLPLGLDCFGGVEGEVTPALQNGDVSYISATLKMPKEQSPERRDMNVDFQLRRSTQYNKLIFDLVRSSRKREFFANLREEYQNWYGYQTAYSELQTGEYIGKGRIRLTPKESKQKRSPIQLWTAMIYNEQEQTARIWIENSYFKLDMDPYKDKQDVFTAKGWYKNLDEQRYTEGGWK